MFFEDEPDHIKAARQAPLTSACRKAEPDLTPVEFGAEARRVASKEPYTRDLMILFKVGKPTHEQRFFGMLPLRVAG